MAKTKIAIIGTGTIFKEHIAAYQNNPDVEVYALCDINEEKVKAAGKEYGVARVFSDMHEMLKLEEIDAVSICTWNVAHAPCAIAALNAKKHVLCEKPMALNAQQAREMKQAADRNGKLLMIGFVRRFGNDCDIVKDFIDNGHFGEVYYAKAAYMRRQGNPGGWFGDKARSGGGPLIDLGVHVIDLARYLGGNPKPVSAYGVTFHKLGDPRHLKGKKGYHSSDRSDSDVCDVEDMVSALVRFDNGMALQFEASYTLNLEKESGTIELFGTKAGAKLDPELEIYTQLNDYQANVQLTAPTALSFDGLFQREIDHFVSCVRENIPCRAPAQDGITLMTILDAIYESAETGHEVLIKG